MLKRKEEGGKPLSKHGQKEAVSLDAQKSQVVPHKIPPKKRES
jgi:hypothetical protein